MKGAACELFSGIRSGRDESGQAILNNLNTPQAHNQTYKKYRSGKLSLKYGNKVGYSTVQHVKPASCDMMPPIVSVGTHTVDTPRPKHYVSEVAARRYGRKSL